MIICRASVFAIGLEGRLDTDHVYWLPPKTLFLFVSVTPNRPPRCCRSYILSLYTAGLIFLHVRVAMCIDEVNNWFLTVRRGLNMQGSEVIVTMHEALVPEIELALGKEKALCASSLLCLEPDLFRSESGVILFPWPTSTDEHNWCSWTGCGDWTRMRLYLSICNLVQNLVNHHRPKETADL